MSGRVISRRCAPGRGKTSHEDGKEEWPMKEKDSRVFENAAGKFRIKKTWGEPTYNRGSFQEKERGGATNPRRITNSFSSDIIVWKERFFPGEKGDWSL